jgi:putative spermidine/putrescine transport system permease protein
MIAPTPTAPARARGASSGWDIRQGRHFRMGRSIDTIALGTVSTIVLLSVLFLVVPLAIVVSMSVDARDYLGHFPPSAFSLQWYDKFFADPYLMKGLRTSLLLALSSSFISTAIGVAGAVAIDRLPRRQREVVMSAFLSPLIVPGVVIGFALLLFYSRIGLESGFLRLLGAHVLITFPYPIRTVLAALAGIRPSMVEAALSLGATERGAFWSITVPLAKTGIAAGAIFSFAFSLDDVAVSLFLSDPHNYTLPVALVSMMHANFDLTIAAAAVLLVGMTILLMVGLDRMVGLDKIFGAGLYRA